MDEYASRFSPLSVGCNYYIQKRELVCSRAAGWTSLLVQGFETATDTEKFEIPPTPDLHLVMAIEGEPEVESFSGRSLRKSVQRRGVIGVTAAGNTDVLRLRALSSKTMKTLHVHIPAYFFAAAIEEYRRAGTSFHLEQPDLLGFTDPMISQIVFSLADAVKNGAPNLYAESAAQFLAVSLLSKNRRLAERLLNTRKAGEISDGRLSRVLEYMEHHCTENPTLEQLSKEAGISRFHFINLFKKSTGVTPHQYLTRLRIKFAAELLEKTDLSIKQIAYRCGYLKTSHFSSNFRAHFSQSPVQYRLQVCRRL